MMLTEQEELKLEDWSLEARRIFHYLYDFMMLNPEAMQHPDAAEIPAAHWKTIAYNAAWTAANGVDNKQYPAAPDDLELA
jgi:hypothetical protein